jgi:hypothetical protein
MAALIHMEESREQRKARTGNDGSPSPFPAATLCLTGDGHRKATTTPQAVTCPICRAKLQEV